MINSDHLQRPETLNKPVSPSANLRRACAYTLLPFLLFLAAFAWLRYEAKKRVKVIGE
jgi:hypothetical protein